MKMRMTRWRWVKCAFFRCGCKSTSVWKEVALYSNELPDAQVKGKGDDLPASPIKVGMKSFRAIWIWMKSDFAIRVIIADVIVLNMNIVKL